MSNQRRKTRPCNLSFSTSPAPRAVPRPGLPLDKEQSIAVGLCGDPAHDEVATMVLDTLQRETIDVVGVGDGDARAWECDVLLLVGSGMAFPRFAQWAVEQPRSRPRIVLWHLQPLPPPVLTQRAGELGQRLLSAQWEDLLGPWASSLSRVLPPRGRVRALLQRILAQAVRNEFARLGGSEQGNVGWNDLCTIFEEAAWLSQVVDSTSCWIDEVASNTPTRVAFLRQCGIAARFVPLGFHSRWGTLNNADRDIDVLYIGTLDSPSRRSLVPQVLRQLKDWGYRTHGADQFPGGEQRTQLLQRSRVVLNVLRFPWEFPGPRLFASAACGALCVSNEAVQNEPFQPGLHYIRSPKSRMAESISWYLTNEEERHRRAIAALQSFTCDFPLLSSIEKLLEPATHEATVHRRAA